MYTLTESVELRSILKFLFIGVLGVAISVYLVYQARFLLIGPVLTLDTEFQPVYNQRIIEVAGNAENITSLTLNGRTIYTDERGHFREPLVLENGYTIMSLRAEDRYGRQTTIEQSFVYVPASSINL